MKLDTLSFVQRTRPAGRVATLAGAAALLAACAAPPARDSAAVPAAPGPGYGAAGTPDTAAAPATTPLSPQEVQRTVVAAIDFLQGGQEEQAEAELKKVLQADPGNRLAQSLMRQIKDDPVATLGRESFPYKVQPGESLSRISQRFMNDVHLFYILARYNGIKVPRNLAGGQTIRVPGKAPPPGALPAAAAPAPATPALTAPTPVAPPAAVSPPPPPPPVVVETPPPAPEVDQATRAARQKADDIAKHTRAARAAFAKQDLDGAIRSWDAVLALDPESRTALLEKQKVVGLKEKLGKVK
jgi:hypothetical protein